MLYVYLCYGLDAPCYQCAAHSSDLVMKRMTKSKTMSVPKVVKAYGCLWRVMKHFEMSTKSKENLNEALAIHEMNHLKLLSWGVTRMAHLSQPANNSLNSVQMFTIVCAIPILKKKSGGHYSLLKTFFYFF